jgi:hypothetical protein
MHKPAEVIAQLGFEWIPVTNVSDVNQCQRLRMHGGQLQVRS